MKVDKILALADRMEGLEPPEYNQKKYFHDCGTPACIGGHACHMEGWIRSRGGTYTVFHPNNPTHTREADEVAQEILGLDDEQTGLLFDGLPSWSIGVPTVSDAVSVLRHLAETGDVRWRDARKGASDER